MINRLGTFNLKCEYNRLRYKICAINIYTYHILSYENEQIEPTQNTLISNSIYSLHSEKVKKNKEIEINSQ